MASFPVYTPPPSPLMRLLPKARAAGVYHHNKPVDEYLPNGYVRVGEQKLLMLAGFSYLGLIKDEALADKAIESLKLFGLGAHGTRLSAGTTALHAELERRLALITRCEDAILFPTGYQANASTIPALFTPRDTIYSDQLNHASIMDGIHRSGARIVTYRHNDMAELEQKLAARDGRNALIVTDSVFSMDGDIADIPKLIALKRRYGALLMVDEAHALGVLGANGFGVAQHFDLPPNAIDLTMGVLSKAVPGTGGYVCASAALVEYLKHSAGSYIYSAAMPPYQAAIALECLRRLETTDVTKKLFRARRHFQEQLRLHGVDIGVTETPITPVMIGDAIEALTVADHCVRNGVYLLSVSFPVVPLGKARLRATVTADHDLDALTNAAEVIAQAIARHAPKALNNAS